MRGRGEAGREGRDFKELAQTVVWLANQKSVEQAGLQIHVRVDDTVWSPNSTVQPAGT